LARGINKERKQRERKGQKEEQYIRIEAEVMVSEAEAIVWEGENTAQARIIS